MQPDSANPSIGPAAAFSGFPLFVIIGATAAMFGPTIPAFRSTFHISAATAGLLLGGHFAGSIAGTLSPSFLPLRLRPPRVLTAVASLCFALGCLTVAASPAWPVPLAGAVVEGAGWGGLVIVFNALFATGFGRRSPTMLTLLNAVYGIGAIVGPALVGLAAGGGFRLSFALAGIAALALLPLALTLPAEDRSVPAAGGASPGSGSPARRPLVLFMLAFFLYGGLEAGIGSWEPTHLIATGLSAAAAATVTSFFWAGYTTGRLVAAPLAMRVRPETLVLICLGGVTVLVLAARISALTAAAYAGGGLFLGPVFPLAVVWAGRRLGASHRSTSLVISSDLLGGAIVPPALGGLVTAAGARSLPIAFGAFAAAMLALLLASRASDLADRPPDLSARHVLLR